MNASNFGHFCFVDRASVCTTGLKERLSRAAAAAQAALVVTVACSAMPAAAQLETRFLYANSECKYPIRIMLHHKDGPNDHHPHAWYVFRPYEENRVQDNNVVLRQVVGANLYVYAETLADSNVPAMSWRGTDRMVLFNNVYYPMMRVPLIMNARGELEFKLRCD